MHGRGGGLDFNKRPLLVFWEATKACMLACRHCRAEAIRRALPGELATEEGLDLIDQVAEFGVSPPPILVFTGGDPLMRRDLWQLLEYAKSKGLRVALAPAVTPALTEDVIAKIADAGVDAVSVSLDSGVAEVHDSIRGVKGTWERSIWAIREFIDYGVRVQVNTLVSRDTVETLPETVKLLVDLGVSVLEAFYIVPVGRAAQEMMLSPQEFEDVGHLLYQASKYGLVVRTTEGPSFRRISLTRMLLEKRGYDAEKLLGVGPLYRSLREKLEKLLGPPKGSPRISTVGTRDGKGIIFVAYNGDVSPSGFMPYRLGNVRRESLVKIYRENPLLKKIRAAEFRGRCGVCEFRDICGGSRARAYMVYGDPLAEDPACPYKPGTFTQLAEKLGIDIGKLSYLLPYREQERYILPNKQQ